MKITKRWLNKHNACKEGIDWIKKQSNKDEIKVIEKLMTLDRFDWANWYIARRLSKTIKVKYAVYAAKQVLKIFEDKYPDDKRPREAIEAAEAYIKTHAKKQKPKPPMPPMPPPMPPMPPIPPMPPMPPMPPPMPPMPPMPPPMPPVPPMPP